MNNTPATMPQVSSGRVRPVELTVVDMLSWRLLAVVREAAMGEC
jgi:hypothetical protein